VRTTWDYFDRRDEFLAWAAAVPRLLNPAEVLTWNTDKRYLHQLEAKGIPIVPTTWLEPGEGFTPPDRAFVVKPTVSAGARNTAAYPAGDTTSAEHVRTLLDQGRRVMVQPYVEAVDAEGETSLLFFDGAFSHAARKAAILTPGGGVSNSIDSRSFVTPADATPEQRELAEAVLRAAPPDLLYVRVDLLPGPVLIELEVTEPSLFLRHAPGSAQRFAQAVARSAAARSLS
jgi:glutathione synthase/RimK-type ligase-like ATP-grasp enzyme